MNYPNYNHEFQRNKVSEPAQPFGDSNIFTPTIDQRNWLGRIWDFNNGDRFRYQKDGGSGITRAHMAATYPPDAELEDELQGSYGVSVGETKFDMKVTTGSGLLDHELTDGIMLVNTAGASGAGDMYIIKDNTWITGDTILYIEIADNGGIRTVIDATENITLVKNKYRDVAVHATDRDAVAIGVPLVDVTADYYFWAKTRGAAPLLVDTGDSPAIGGPIGEPTGTASVAGACGVINADGTDAIWGRVLYAAAADDYALVDLMLE